MDIWQGGPLDRKDCPNYDDGPKQLLVVSVRELREIAGSRGPLSEDARRILDDLGYDVLGRKKQQEKETLP